MTTTSVGELQRAWRAVQTGMFRTPATPTPRAAEPSPVWVPEPGERVVPVMAAHPGAGATVVALAVATAAAPARVVECAGLAAAGLAAAPTAELGEHAGWVQGSRGDVIVERLPDTVADPARVPFPPPLDRISHLTVIDISRDPTTLSPSGGWLAGLLDGAPWVVVVGSATVPGLRRVETCLLGLDPARCIAALVGPLPRRWPRSLAPGAATSGLIRTSRLVPVPIIPGVRLGGVDTSDLPGPLLAAARRIVALATAGISREDL